MVREKAIALEYQDVSDLPRVVASGVGEVARQIIRIAEQNQVPVQRDELLTEMLSELGAGASITPESFRLVAEVVCFLYETDRQWKEKHEFLEPVIGPALNVPGENLRPQRS